MKKKKRIIVPQSSKASASSESSSLCSSDTVQIPCKSTQAAECSENDLNSPQEPQPGTSTGGVTPSGLQLNTSTRGSVRCAGKRRVYKEYGSDSSESSSSSDSNDSGDDEWRPAVTSTVPQNARKTNNPSG